MTGAGATTTNVAENVGIQGEYVYNSTVYQVMPDAPPQKKYEVGIQYLEDGVPLKARELIGDARAYLYDTAEVRFHWMLAMFSKRSYRDLSAEERSQLRTASIGVSDYADSEWKRALKAICDLLECLNDRTADPGPALKEVQTLPTPQRDKISRHLDLVLTGTMKDGLWAETRRKAERDRSAHARSDRVWAYFQPEPARPQARQVVVPATTVNDWVIAVAWSGLLALTATFLGWLTFAHPTPVPIAAYVIALIAAGVGAWCGQKWRYQAHQLLIRDRIYAGLGGVREPVNKKFANEVGHSCAYYFGKYLPKNMKRERWLTETRGIRIALRDEVSDAYSGTQVTVEQVNWLIRYHARDIRHHQQEGTLLSYRDRYRVGPAVRAAGSVAVTALAVTAFDVVSTAFRSAPVLVSFAVLGAIIGGWGSGRRWMLIISEHRRYAEEDVEREKLMARRTAEYERWKAKLDNTRPSETEMEAWLTCDKTFVLDKALRHYQLAWRDIIAHAVFQTPGKNCKRARISGGQRRYSKYDIRLFLITQDGVRDVNVEIDFEHALVNAEERENFRFDAVSSVHVGKSGESGYTLELTLTNGPTRTIPVTDPVVQQSADNAEISLDASGFAHALHILEGIAAEGKNWVDRDFATDLGAA